MFNLGHGITPEVDPEHVRVLVDEVHVTDGCCAAVDAIASGSRRGCPLLAQHDHAIRNL